jgi:DNA mismatch repair protein MutS2
VKPAQLLDGASAEVLAFSWLAEAAAPVSPYGERHFSGLGPFRPGEESAAQSRAERIAAIAAAFDASALEAMRRELAAVPDAAGAIARAAMGEALSDDALYEVRSLCETIERIERLRASEATLDSLSNGAVRAIGAALATGQRNAIEFYLADAFDAQLATARTRAAAAQAELEARRGRELERVARELGRDELRGDEFIVMRADVRGGLPAGLRVLREAPTYLLCALEYDSAVLASLERRDAAAEAVAVAEERVRVTLSALVRSNAAGLLDAAQALGELDVLTAAAAFAQRFHCVAPEVTTKAALAFEGARFLPLESELRGVGRSFTPLDLDLHDAAVLTGPNMGGKSVCLLTCGFVATCAAFGLPVPASRARIALFDRIGWLGTGRSAHVGGLLSSFAQEVLALKELLAIDAPRLLLLVDEFARTTTPHEGKALSIALLERLRARQACALVATHLEGLAAAAGVRHFAVRGLRGIPTPPPTQDVGEALALLADSMDYRVAEIGAGEGPRADAIALTALLGLDGRFVEAAYRALS